jgi:hypothetical protein
MPVMSAPVSISAWKLFAHTYITNNHTHNNQSHTEHNDTHTYTTTIIQRDGEYTQQSITHTKHTHKAQRQSHPYTKHNDNTAESEYMIG